MAQENRPLPLIAGGRDVEAWACANAPATAKRDCSSSWMRQKDASVQRVE